MTHGAIGSLYQILDLIAHFEILKTEESHESAASFQLYKIVFVWKTVTCAKGFIISLNFHWTSTIL